MHQQRNRCVQCTWLSVLQLQILSYRTSEMSQFITVCLQVTVFCLVINCVSAISSVRFGKWCCTGDDPWRLQTPVENDPHDDLCIWQADSVQIWSFNTRGIMNVNRCLLSHLSRFLKASNVLRYLIPPLDGVHVMFSNSHERRQRHQIDGPGAR